MIGIYQQLSPDKATRDNCVAAKKQLSDFRVEMRYGTIDSSNTEKFKDHT